VLRQVSRKAINLCKVIAIDEIANEPIANKEIEYLKKFGSSITWDIPEEFHHPIIDDLFSRFGGRTLASKHTYQLEAWSSRQIAEHVAF
jgi:hypothetical protein